MQVLMRVVLSRLGNSSVSGCIGRTLRSEATGA